MKRFLIIITLFISVSFMFGCNNVKELVAVENINFDEFLTWNAVEHADNYVVNVNGEEFVVPVPYLFIAAEGSYEVSVYAKADGYKDSLVSEFSFEIDYDQNASIVLSMNDGNLSWNEVAKATHYFLVIGSEVIRLENTNYEYEGSLTEEVYVYAIFPDGSKTANSNILN
jgi:hypothetical protein